MPAPLFLAIIRIVDKQQQILQKEVIHTIVRKHNSRGFLVWFFISHDAEGTDYEIGLFLLGTDRMPFSNYSLIKFYRYCRRVRLSYILRLKSFSGEKKVAFIVPRRRDGRREIITSRENRANPRDGKLADAQNAILYRER